MLVKALRGFRDEWRDWGGNMARRWPDLERFGARLTFDGAEGALTIEVRTNNYDIGIAAAGFMPAAPHKWRRRGPNIRLAELATIFSGFDKDVDTKMMGDGAVMWSDTGFCANLRSDGSLIESEFEIECEIFPALERAFLAMSVDAIVGRLSSFCWPPRSNVSEEDAEVVRAMCLSGRINWNTYGIFTAAVIDAFHEPEEDAESGEFRAIVEIIEEAELTHVIHLHGLQGIKVVAAARQVPADVIGSEYVQQERERIGKDLCTPSPLMAALDEIDGDLLQWVEIAPDTGVSARAAESLSVDVEQVVVVGVDRLSGALLIMKDPGVLSRLALTGLRMAPPAKAILKAKGYLEDCYGDVQRQVKESSRQLVSAILLNRMEGMINQAGAILGYAQSVGYERSGFPRVVQQLSSEPFCLLFSDLWTRASRLGAAGAASDAEEEMVEPSDDDLG